MLSVIPEAFRSESFPLRTQDIDFLIPNPFRGEDHVGFLNQLKNLRVPNPANFCLHKLIIASRRRKTDKSLKDIQQAICTSVIVNKTELLNLFNSLPKKWRAAIIRMIDRSRNELPVLMSEIEAIGFTLQGAGKK